MGVDRRRLEAAALVLVLVCAGSVPLLSEGKAAGCGCPLPCTRCCCAPDAPGDAEICVLRDRSSTPRPEVPQTPQPRIREAFFAAPATLPHPVLEDRLASPAFLLPASLVLSPEVPPPRPNDAP